MTLRTLPKLDHSELSILLPVQAPITPLVSTARCSLVTHRVDGKLYVANFDLTRTHAGVWLDLGGVNANSKRGLARALASPLLGQLHRRMAQANPYYLDKPISLAVNDPTTWRMPGPELEADPFHDSDLHRILVGAMHSLKVSSVSYFDLKFKPNPDLTLRETLQPLMYWLARVTPVDGNVATPDYADRIIKPRGRNARKP